MEISYKLPTSVSDRSHTSTVEAMAFSRGQLSFQQGFLMTYCASLLVSPLKENLIIGNKGPKHPKWIQMTPGRIQICLPSKDIICFFMYSLYIATQFVILLLLTSTSKLLLASINGWKRRRDGEEALNGESSTDSSIFWHILLPLIWSNSPENPQQETTSCLAALKHVARWITCVFFLVRWRRPTPFPPWQMHSRFSHHVTIPRDIHQGARDWRCSLK